MTDEQALQAWWERLTPEQRDRAAAIALRPAPRGMAVDDLAATMLVAGLPTARMVWTGQPEHLVEMLDEVAEFVNRVSRTS
ncbi:MAG: hypothetical protein IT193_03115 [Propionibacteriaceae bacterium]|nr:hypothetical protein [Propionibacteriaceae bacterium]